MITPTTKVDVGHDEELSRKAAIETGIVDRDTWDELAEATIKLYEFYESKANQRGIIIPDFKIEFGWYGKELIQIDEPPTHDSARMWARKYYRPGEAQERHCLDKEFLRECLRRLGYSGEGRPPVLPKRIVGEVVKRCVGAYNVLAEGASIEGLDLAGVDDIFK
jgi:phosphoribosylaminoimidazole-succinocarboxamide synthase